MYAIRSYYDLYKKYPNKSFIVVNQCTKEGNVITSYSIHYTKLYEELHQNAVHRGVAIEACDQVKKIRFRRVRMQTMLE